MRTAVASAPMAFFPFSWMQLPREGCAKIQRGEAEYIMMFAPGLDRVNRNEYENRALPQEYDRISWRVVSHKRYSFPRNRFWHFLRNPSRRDPHPSRPQRQR